MSTPALRLDWCSHAAAKYAVEHWHYSRRLPMPPLVKIGVWEVGRFIGCVLFSRGANLNLGHQYGLDQTEVAELTRVALAAHQAAVSRVISVALGFLRRQCPGLRLVVSFADPAHGHHGGIYQASGWLYVGTSSPDREYWHEGRWKHSREMRTGAFGGPRRVADYSGLPTRVAVGKHKYLWPLDPTLRPALLSLVQSYPKPILSGRASGESDTPAVQAGEGAAMRPHGSLALSRSS